MAIKRQMCANHPDRIAIGACVITKKPMCAECSTRYEGVNYSREGLAELRLQRATQAKAVSRWQRVATLGLIGASPVFLCLMYYFYLSGFRTAIMLCQWGR